MFDELFNADGSTAMGRRGAFCSALIVSDEMIYCSVGAPRERNRASKNHCTRAFACKIASATSIAKVIKFVLRYIPARGSASLPLGD